MRRSANRQAQGGKRGREEGSTVEVEWDERSVEALELLKLQATKDLALFQPDPGLPFIVHIDASDYQ